MTKNLELIDDPNLFFNEFGLSNQEINSIKDLLAAQNQAAKNIFYRWLLSGANNELHLEFDHLALSAPRRCTFKLADDKIEITIPAVQPSTPLTVDKKVEFWDSFKRCYSEGIFFTDKDGTILETSDRTTQILQITDEHGILLNRDAILGTKLESYLDEKTKKKLSQFMAASQPNSLNQFERVFEHQKRFLEIKGYTLYQAGVPNGYMFLIFDITKTMRTEKQLTETQETISQKSHLIVLGELAGKIAHEINSPLGAILLTANNAESNIENLTLEECRKYFATISRTSLFISEIIKNLVNFSKKDETLALSLAVDLTEVFADVIDLVKASLKSQNIRFDVDIPMGLLIDGRKAQLQQVFLNLISNSVNAIKKLDTKWISIQAKQIENFIEISFIDSGNGIATETANKIMAEYLSTKELGQGLGIGLSICRSVVLSHGGTFLLDQNHSNTCFKINLPVSELSTFNS